MISSDTKQQVLDDFCLFLENFSESEMLDEIESRSTVDLLTLCKEFIALKTEVKQESRQFKIALDSFKEVFNTLQSSHDVLARELTIRRQEQSVESEKQQNALLKPLILDLIDLRDRLEMGVVVHHSYRPNWFARMFKREQNVIASMHEGQSMTLRRVDQLLSNYEVTALDTLQQIFDPQCMRAVELVARSDLANGVVVTEVRKGYRWKNDILRFAEVIVNKNEE